MDKSGTTAWMASQLLAMGQHLSGFWILTFFILITSVLTEILSNNATVVTNDSHCSRGCQNLHLNPYAFMFAVTFAASNSYLTPIGYQTNTMVYGQEIINWPIVNGFHAVQLRIAPDTQGAAAVRCRRSILASPASSKEEDVFAIHAPGVGSTALLKFLSRPASFHSRACYLANRVLAAFRCSIVTGTGPQCQCSEELE
jgi:hypothetical protein